VRFQHNGAQSARLKPRRRGHSGDPSTYDRHVEHGILALVGASLARATDRLDRRSRDGSRAPRVLAPEPSPPRED
jgi:hypothetical protein